MQNTSQEEQQNMISQKQVKELLGEKWSKHSTQQIEFLIKELTVLANIFIGNYLNSVKQDDA